MRLGETERPLPVRKRIFGRAWPYRAPVRDGHVPTWPQLLNGENVPCTVRIKQQFVPKEFVDNFDFLRQRVG